MLERRAAIALIWLVPFAALANKPAPPRPEVVWPGAQVLHEVREPKEQCRVWLPKLTAQDSMTWSGACVDGTAQGLGILFLQHSPSRWDRYDGALLNGRMHGQGVLAWATGVRYEGSFVDGQLTGEATLTWGKNGRYVGEFKNGRPDGQGMLQLDGTPGARQLERALRYEGTWQNGCYLDSDKKAWASWGPERVGWLDSCP